MISFNSMSGARNAARSPPSFPAGPSPRPLRRDGFSRSHSLVNDVVSNSWTFAEPPFSPLIEEAFVTAPPLQEVHVVCGILGWTEIHRADLCPFALLFGLRLAELVSHGSPLFDRDRHEAYPPHRRLAAKVQPPEYRGSHGLFTPRRHGNKLKALLRSIVNCNPAGNACFIFLFIEISSPIPRPIETLLPAERIVSAADRLEALHM